MWSRAARSLWSVGVTSRQLTAAGFFTGVAAAVLVAIGWWWVALVVWLTSRVFDGLDGAVARFEGPTAAGGYLDVMADFAVYAAFVVGIAVQVPDARLGAVVLLAAYYVSGAAFLAWAAATRSRQSQRGDRRDRGLALGDDRSVEFVGGLAEGFETIVVYALVCVMPQRATAIVWFFALMVGVTAVQRIRFALVDLSSDDTWSAPPVRHPSRL